MNPTNSKNSEPNLTNESEEKWPRLHVAVWHGFYTIVEGMIRTGSPADSSYSGTTGRGFTPLHLAALKNQLKCAEILLECGASLSPKTGAACDPIHIAVFKNHREMAALLLSHGCDVNLRFSGGFFELFHHKLPSGFPKDDNLPLLHCSIILKRKKITELLINSGADINLKTNSGKTALMQAIKVNDLELVTHLVKKGADVNDCDSYGQPVLHFTVHNAIRKKSIFTAEENTNDVKKEKVEIVKCLVEGGADVNARFPHYIPKSAVIHYMMLYGFSYGVMYLLYCGDLDWNDVDLDTVLHGELMTNKSTTNLSSNYLRELRREHAHIMFLIMQWAANRYLLGLPYHRSIIDNQPIHNLYYQSLYAEKLVTDWQLADKLINVMRDTEFEGTSVSFYYLLTCSINKLIRLTANQSLRSLEESIYKANLNHPFDFMLIRRINFAKKRKLLILKATEVVSCLLVGHLPYDCCQNIVEHFNNRELSKIIVPGNRSRA